GQNTSQPDLAEPRTTAVYSMCIYSGAAHNLVGEVTVMPGSGWSQLGTKGFKYFDSSGTQDGAQKILLKSSATAHAKAYLKGGGLNLPDPIDTTALQSPVTVQLINYGASPQPVCFESNFTHFSKSSLLQFKAKAP